MARADLLNNIYAALRADTTLLALLGPVTGTNRRIYRAYPQTTPTLTATEPAREGWLVLQEMSDLAQIQDEQLTTIQEIMDVQVHLYVTATTLAQQVIDRIDARYHWRVPQEQEVQYSNWILLKSRRFTTTEEWNQNVKLYYVKTAYRTIWVEETVGVS